MIGLNTARVAILDDKPEEGLPILEAISRKGIAAAYFSAQDKEHLPETPLCGVRLLILDLNLFGDGAPDIKLTAGKVIDTISTENGPFVILAWTKHPEEVGSLQEAILQYSNGNLMPLAVLTMSKDSFLADKYDDGDKIYDVNKILTELQKEQEKYFPVDLFMRWEAATHKAAIDITHLITKTAAEKAGGDSNIATSMQERVIAALAEAHLGRKAKKIADGKQVLDAVIHSLAPIHSDKLLRDGITADGPFKKRLLSKIQAKITCNADACIMNLNSTMLITDYPGNATPGTVFLLENPEEFGLKGLRHEICPIPDDFLKKYKCDNGIESNTAARKAIKCELSTAKIVFVELSNNCDYAQEKQKYYRVVAGILLPYEYRALASTGAFTKQIGPMMYGDDYWCLIMNARHLQSLKLGSIFGSPIFSLREQALVDSQAWLASYIARPGMLTLSID